MNNVVFPSRPCGTQQRHIGIQWCADKYLTSGSLGGRGGEALVCSVFSNFHGINTPIRADFKPPIDTNVGQEVNWSGGEGSQEPWGRAQCTTGWVVLNKRRLVILGFIHVSTKGSSSSFKSTASYFRV